jgi:hypothetical protein
MLRGLVSWPSGLADRFRLSTWNTHGYVFVEDIVTSSPEFRGDSKRLERVADRVEL